MSDTTQTPAIGQVPLEPPPRITGDYSVDSTTLADYLSDLFTGLTGTPTSIDPSSQVSPSNATLGTAQLTANTAYSFCQAINAALASAGVSGFPVSEPTS